MQMQRATANLAAFCEGFQCADGFVGALAKHGNHGLQISLVESWHNGAPPRLPGLQICRDQAHPHDWLQDLSQHALVIVEGIVLQTTMLIFNKSVVPYGMSSKRLTVKLNQRWSGNLQKILDGVI